VDIYEFEKMELNSQEEMEKAARQYAEEQLAAVQGELKAAHQAAAAQAAQAAALWQQCQGLQAQADAQHQADQEQAAQLQQRVTQVGGGVVGGLQGCVHVCSGKPLAQMLHP
jgi:uncharacterized protein YPO0396